MGCTASSQTKSIQKAADARIKPQRKVAALVGAMASGAVTSYMASHITKTTMHDSILSGQAWLQEILSGHPSQFHNSMGMSKFAFLKLVCELRMYANLQATKHISAEEQLAMFLHLAYTGNMYSSSKNCPNVWPFCNVWVITQW